MRVILAALGLVLVPAALAGSVPAPVLLPKPDFPAPAREPSTTGPELVVVSARYRDPGTLPPDRPAPPAWTQKSFRGAAFESAIRQGRRVFLVYGGRYLMGADEPKAEFHYTYDLGTFTRPPNGGEFEPVTWAREVDGVLYVSNSHLSSASTTRGRNAYVSAIDLAAKKTLWRSRALVANARTFIIAGDLIVAGYGFTAEPDFLYLLDRRTGEVLDRLAIPSAPEIIKLRNDLLHVRTYDRRLVVRIRG
jgi:hypothetical protein